MTIEIINDGNFSLGFDMEEVANQTVKGVLSVEKFPEDAYVCITLVSEEEIQSINKEQRDIDSVTDVLSFPMIPWSFPANYNELSDFSDIKDPETGEIMLGDVVLCIPKVVSQAKEYGHSKRREFAFLICHSMLHLLGYDHMEENDRILMEEHQNKIMDYINISRE